MRNNKVKVLAKGDVLILEGDEGRNMYLLNAGVLAVYLKKGERDVFVTRISQGELVGEMSFLDQKPRSATVVAETMCEVTEIAAESYQSVIDAQPTWLKALTNTLVDRLRSINEKIVT